MIKDKQMDLDVVKELYSFFSIREKEILEEDMKIIEELIQRINSIEQELKEIKYVLYGNELTQSEISNYLENIDGVTF